MYLGLLIKLIIFSCFSYEKILNDLNQKGFIFSTQRFASIELNFGAIHQSKRLTIYRSKGLGNWGKKILIDHLLNHNLAIPSRIIYMNKQGYINGPLNIWTLRFALEENENQFFLHPKTNKQIKYEFLHPLNPENPGISYISGKNPLEVNKKDIFSFTIDRDGKAYNYFTDGGVKNIKYVLLKILEKEQTVLIHCKGGIHRTGMISILLRGIIDNRWLSGNDVFPQNIKVTKSYFDIQTVTLHNPAEFEYFLHNPDNFRLENIYAVRKIATQKWYRCLQQKFETAKYDQLSRCMDEDKT